MKKPANKRTDKLNILFIKLYIHITLFKKLHMSNFVSFPYKNCDKKYHITTLSIHKQINIHL